MSRAFACANQRLMASPLRQTSHSAMHRGFLPPFLLCGCWCNFFFTAPFLDKKKNHSRDLRWEERCSIIVWGPVVQWLVRRFRSERLRVRSRRSATFTPSAHVRRQSLPVWPPTLNNYLYLYLLSDTRWRTISTGQKSRTSKSRMTWSLVIKHDHKMIEQCSSHRKSRGWFFLFCRL